MNTKIGKIMKECREYNSFSAQQVATFLGIERSTYANYEAGLREAPLEVLEKCADLYGCDLDIFFGDKALSETDMLICAFRVDDVSPSDMTEVALFKNIVKNYLKMENLLAL